VCVLSETGQLVRRTQVRIEEMMRLLEGLPDRFEVCYEASSGYGHYHDLLRPIASRVTVAHPGRLRLIVRSKNKNDRRDAERLGKLLYLAEAAAVHAPSGEVGTWRELITRLGPVIAKRTQAKNSLPWLPRCADVVALRRPGVCTKRGLEWLRRLELPTTSQRLRRDLPLEQVEALTRQAQRIEQQLNHQVGRSSPVGRLCVIPGVAVRTAEAVAAFIIDPHRFADARAGRGCVAHQRQGGGGDQSGEPCAQAFTIEEEYADARAGYTERGLSTVSPAANWLLRSPSRAAAIVFLVWSPAIASTRLTGIGFRYFHSYAARSGSPRATSRGSSVLSS
jgi:hypothetical protein